MNVWKYMERKKENYIWTKNEKDKINKTKFIEKKNNKLFLCLIVNKCFFL